MNETKKAELQANMANSYKMASVWVISVVSGGAAALGKYFLDLTPEQQTQAIAFVAQNHLWLIPILTGISAWYARVHPQSGIVTAIEPYKSTPPTLAVRAESETRAVELDEQIRSK